MLFSHAAQIEVSPQNNQKKLIKFCKERDIIVTAYCPLGRPIPAEKKPSFLYDNAVKQIADRYKKTAAQVVFRYLVRSIPFACLCVCSNTMTNHPNSCTQQAAIKKTSLLFSAVLLSLSRLAFQMQFVFTRISFVRVHRTSISLVA